MFTAKDAVIAAGMEKQKPTFDRWLQANIARPAVPSQGRGYPAIWDSCSMIALVLTKRLGKIGMNLKIAAEIAEKVSTKYYSYPPEWSASVGVDLKTHEFLLEIDTPEEFAVPITETMDFWSIDRDMFIVVNVGRVQKTILDRLGISTKTFWENTHSNRFKNQIK